jgi:hypothetical protein
MKLELFLLAGFEYGVHVHQVPFVVMLSSASEVQISRTVHLVEEVLELTQDEDVWFGHVRSISSRVNEDTFGVGPGTPHFVVGQVVVEDDDVAAFVPGTYPLSAGIVVFEARVGGFTPRELKTSVTVEIR